MTHTGPPKPLFSPYVLATHLAPAGGISRALGAALALRLVSRSTQLANCRYTAIATTHPHRAGGIPEGARRSEANRRLLEVQSPALAAEGLWAHATTGPEAGGLLLSTRQAPALLHSERMWQVGRGRRHVAASCCTAAGPRVATI